MSDLLPTVSYSLQLITYTNMNEEKKTFEYWNQVLNDTWWMQIMSMIHKGKDIKQAALESFGHLINDPIRLERMEHNDFKTFVNGWLSRKPFPKRQNVVDKNKYELR